MFKRKQLAVEAMILAILFASVFQISAVGTSVSSRFSGIVYAATGVPIANAMVIASGTAGSGYATTSPSGQYTIDKGIPTGTYTVSVIKEGYLEAEVENVQVTVGSETTGINLYLSLSGGISGKVTNAVSGLPISNIAVYAFAANGSFGWYGSTDSNGNYNIFTNLATGTYNVSAFMPEGYSMKSTTATVTAGVQTTGVNLALDPSGIISGMITTPDGAPLANVTITAVAGEGQYYGFAQTDATGHYRISSGLGTGTYEVMAIYYAGGMIPSMNTTEAIVTAGAETSNVDLQLTVSPPPASGIITGKVTDASSSRPIVDAHVVASGPSGNGQADTDGDGNYAISSGLGTGTYSVTASAPGYQQQSKSGVSVTVYQTTANIDFQLSPVPPAQSGKISGTIQGDANPIPEFQYPIAMLFVTTLVVLVLAKSFKTKSKFLQHD